MNLSDVVKTSIFLSNMDNFNDVNKVYGSYLNSGEEPARPEHCGLYLISPKTIEIWKEGDFRTHLREKFTKKNNNKWESCFLSP